MTAPEVSQPALELVCRGAAELLRTLDRPLRRLTVRVGDILVEVEWPAPAGAQPEASAPVPAPAAAEQSTVADPTSSAPAAPDQSAHLVTAPHVGTFYHSPEPGSDPFVTEGDVVRCGQQIGILEAMKLMNPVEADRDGRVVKVLVADGTPVEFEQPLISLVATDDGADHSAAAGPGAAVGPGGNGHGGNGKPPGGAHGVDRARAE